MVLKIMPYSNSVYFALSDRVYAALFSTLNKADAKGGQAPPLWRLGPPTSNDSYHQYTI